MERCGDLVTIRRPREISLAVVSGRIGVYFTAPQSLER